jgi:hypothetical protein
MDLQHTYFPWERHIMGLGCWLWSSHKLFCRWAMYGLYVYCMCCCMVCFLQTSLLLGIKLLQVSGSNYITLGLKHKESVNSIRLNTFIWLQFQDFLKDPSIYHIEYMFIWLQFQYFLKDPLKYDVKYQVCALLSHLLWFPPVWYPVRRIPSGEYQMLFIVVTTWVIICHWVNWSSKVLRLLSSRGKILQVCCSGSMVARFIPPLNL